MITLGAGGVFTLPVDIHLHKQIFFFAAGAGIIPIYSLIKTVLFSYPEIQVILIYNNSSLEKIIFYQPLRDLELLFKRHLHIEFLFSNAANLLKAHLHGELISTYLHIYTIHSFRKSRYFICGPDGYMRLCTTTLQVLNIPPENIKKEIFNTSKPLNKIEPLDKTTRNVEIIINGEKQILKVKYPFTILQAAKKIMEWVLPYSCEVSRCGNCMATCISGKIWMSYNEVLTEKELVRGLILTCTGFPIETDATISFDAAANIKPA